ncbi:MAG: hypothetical protein WBB19_10615 [Desulforhopalus sp.]
MLHRVLLVKSDIYSDSKLMDLLSENISAFDFTIVKDRKEAGAVLKQKSFDQIVTALKIPRISDGYVFLAQIVDKYFKNESIVVVVDEKTENVVSSLNSRGVKHIYSADNLESVVAVLAKAIGITSSVSGTRQVGPAGEKHDLDKVKTVLNYVMGPVGNMIFSDVVHRWQDHNDLNELYILIQNEIQDDDKIKLFRESLG